MQIIVFVICDVIGGIELNSLADNETKASG